MRTSPKALRPASLRLPSLLAVSVVVWLAMLIGAGQAFAGLEWLGGKSGEFPNSAAEIEIEAKPRGIATNNATGDLYEADGELNRVLRFDGEGRFLEAWGWGVVDGAAKFERCGPAGSGFEPCRTTERGRGVPGEGEGQLKELGAIAVDQATGDVYVASVRNTGVIEQFSPEGTPIAAFGESGEGAGQITGVPEYGGLTVDAAGNVYVAVKGVGGKPPRVFEYEQVAPTDHVFARELFSGKLEFISYIAVDRAGDFVLGNGAAIAEFSAGELTTPKWTVHPTEAEGITSDPETGRVFYYAPKEDEYHIISAAGVDERGFAGASGQRVGGAAVYDPSFRIGGRPPGVLYADEETQPSTKKAPRGLIFAGSATNPPLLGAEKVSAVGANFATVQAEVNPQSFTTTYRFEYGTQGPCSADPCTSAPAAGASAGNGNAPVPVGVALSSLSPATTYHYRVVAENQFGPAEGADATFTTYPAPSGALPDHRAYEMVSPGEKHGGEVFPLNAHVTSCGKCEPGYNATKMPEQAAPDGESVVYEGFPFEPRPEAGTGAVNENEYLAHRTPSGWTTSFITPSGASGTAGRGYTGFAQALTAAVITQREPKLAPGALEPPSQVLYVQQGGALRALVTEPPVLPKKEFTLEFGGGSSDFSHLVFQADGALTHQTAFAPTSPEASAEEPNLYEWSASGLRLVNVLSPSKAVPGAVLGAGTTLGGLGLGSAPDYCGAVSSDGSHVFWSKLSNGRVFVREDGERTIQIPDTGRFLCASADGSRVVLGDGHVYDLANEATTDLTHGKGGFLGLVGASEDLSRVYYVDSAVLPAVEGPDGSAPAAGADNLYLYDGGTGTTYFIATLSSVDNSQGPNGVEGDWTASPSDRTAQVTSDGRFLAIESRAALTGPNSAPSSGPCRMEAGIRACPEVFEYDAAGQTLECVSCNPAGLPPAGGSSLSLLFPIGSVYPQPRNLTSSGRLYFDSFDALSTEDVRPGVENVYEHERSGQGTCTSAAGCTLLISSGRTALDSSFFSADSSGRDVFFTTRQQLLPELDQDELVDLYDAREGGGFAIASPPASCSGEQCRPAPTVAAATAGPPSATFDGPGNLPPPAQGVRPTVAVKKPAKCPKGKTRRHGKCVRARHKRKAKHARRASPSPAARRPGSGR